MKTKNFLSLFMMLCNLSCFAMESNYDIGNVGVIGKIDEETVTELSSEVDSSDTKGSADSTNTSLSASMETERTILCPKPFQHSAHSSSRVQRTGSLGEFKKTPPSHISHATKLSESLESLRKGKIKVDNHTLKIINALYPKTPRTAQEERTVLSDLIRIFKKYPELANRPLPEIGLTPLAVVASQGNLAWVKRFTSQIKQNSDTPNQDDYELLFDVDHIFWNLLPATALSVAVDQDEPRLFYVIEYLLEEGASPNVPEYFPRTPIQTALGNNNHLLVKLLMEYGARLHARSVIFPSYTEFLIKGAEYTSFSTILYATRLHFKQQRALQRLEAEEAAELQRRRTALVNLTNNNSPGH